MESSHTLDTLIVLAALYVGGATVCSFTIEAFAGALQLRGSTLYRGLVNIAAGWRQIIDALYQHPLVYPSGETPKYSLQNRLWAWLGAENNWPSYLEARNFSVAFWETLHGTLNAGTGAAVVNAACTPEQLLGDLRARIDGIDPNTPGVGLLKSTLTAMLVQAGNGFEPIF